MDHVDIEYSFGQSQSTFWVENLKQMKYELKIFKNSISNINN